jgi:hypothetical protein
MGWGFCASGGRRRAAGHKIKMVRKTPLERVGSSGVFSILNYLDLFIVFQWHYAMPEINKT